MSKILIHLAKPDDVKFAEECAFLAYDKYIARIGRPPPPMLADFAQIQADNKLSIVTFDDEPAAFSVGYPKPDFYHLDNVAVLPSFQGKGIGKAIFDYAEAQAKLCGRSEIQLYTHVKMTENIAWYTSIGFEEFDRRHEEGVDRIYFRKQV